MGKIVVDSRGRILLPKNVREQLNIRPGQKMRVDIQKNAALIRPSKDIDLLKRLKGRIQHSDEDPLELKNIWQKQSS